MTEILIWKLAGNEICGFFLHPAMFLYYWISIIIIWFNTWCFYLWVYYAQSTHKFKNLSNYYTIIDTDLHNVVKRGNILKDIHKRYIMYQLFKGMHYMHSGNVIHRDQKVQRNQCVGGSNRVLWHLIVSRSIIIIHTSGWQ